MHATPRLWILLAVVLTVGVPVESALAAGPRNPYSGFNLSGVNWGAQQWERDQRAGHAVWPYYNVPPPGRSRGPTVGGAGRGAVLTGTGISRPAPRAVRRWRR